MFKPKRVQENMFKMMQGGGGSQASTVNITISALDGADVQRVLSRPESKGLIETFAAKSTAQRATRSFNASPYERRRGG